MQDVVNLIIKKGSVNILKTTLTEDDGGRLEKQKIKGEKEDIV